jgi:hypothetical protein
LEILVLKLTCSVETEENEKMESKRKRSALISKESLGSLKKRKKSKQLLLAHEVTKIGDHTSIEKIIRVNSETKQSKLLKEEKMQSTEV